MGIMTSYNSSYSRYQTREVTNMSGVIKKERMLRRIREQNAGDPLPLWALYPMLPYDTPVAKLISIVILLQLFVIDVYSY